MSEGGIMKRFNGLVIGQNRFNFNTSFGTYTKSFLAIHGWYDPVNKETNLIEPIQPDSIKELDQNNFPGIETEVKEI